LPSRYGVGNMPRRSPFWTPSSQSTGLAGEETMIREDVITLKQHVVVDAAPINVTDSAAGKLKEVMAAKGLAEAGLRVFVSGGGCSGLQYGMAFEAEGGDPDDLTFNAQGLTLFVDPISIQYLEGANIDYVESLMGGGFKIENPNAVSSCGCGTSFKAANGGSAAPAAGGGGGGGGSCCSGH
jgi:iron-sulfur cluster assembly accessory protein